jgi:pyruvate dehydrogenase E1 component alpha subunit
MAEAGTVSREEEGVAPEKLLRGVPEDVALEILEEMLLYRRFEEKAEEAYAIGMIGGFCHLHIGQEGVAAGCIKPLRTEDYILTSYRDHTQAIAKGVDPKAVMAELFGRAGGCSGGKGGSMHMFDPAVGFMGGHGIVGGQVPLAAGMGFAAKYRGEERVTVCFMGDAAVNQGGFHEALNMSAVWDLPVLYVVENNEYGMGTAFRRVSTTDIKDRACAYGIESSSVNGQDVLETYNHCSNLVDEIRAGGGPRYLEVRTYRFKGHSMSDPVSGTYRSRAEVESRRDDEDPIKILRDRLFQVGALTQEGLEEMDERVRTVVDEAHTFAEESPIPAPEALYTNVWAEINEHGRLFLDRRPEAPAPGETPATPRDGEEA